MKQFSFGKAIRKLKLGRKVARVGWAGRNSPTMNMFLFMVMSPDKTTESGCLNLPPEHSSVWDLPQRSVICLKDDQDQILIGWTPSQADMLAVDWLTVNGR